MLKRALVAFFGMPFAVAIVMTVVDSYRRRGKKPKPFPTEPPGDVLIGDGSVRTYTYGQHLYDDMLDAITSAKDQILFESYIWKGDEVGERFKKALTEAAGRGVEVYAIYDGFANLVVSPRFKRFGPRLRVLEYPFYSAGWRFFDIRRYGRDHRKILVVDDRVGFVGGYNVGSAYATEWRDTHVRITGTSTAAPAAAGGRCSSRPPRTGSRGSGCTGTSPGSGSSRSGRCTWRRSTGPTSTST